MKVTDNSSLRIGAWRVDPALDEISKDGNTVKLERRAMQLLLYLAEHAGQVVSVEQLLDQVWAGVVVTPDSVYHAVAALRRMLGDDSHDPTYIANVPRRGYRLVALVTSVDATSLSGVKSQAPSVKLPTVTVANDKSIAVLPFADMSEKKDQEYFADGMAEEIRALLSKIPAIRVIGRSSSSQFKGKNEDLRKIGAKLNVAYVLEGSVRKAANRVRVAAQLINVKDGMHHWSETYDRDMGDVLKMQDEIAAALVRAPQITVGATGLQPRRKLTNAEAYNLYLHGRYAFDRIDRDGFDQAAHYFQQAIDLDPGNTDAATSLALTHELQGEWVFAPSRVAMEQARREATAALKLDPNLALAHVVLARVHLTFDWDWVAAERELKQALASAPHHAWALNTTAQLLTAVGRYDEALTQVSAALAQDPFDPMANQVLDFIQVRRGRLPEAEAAARRVLEITPTYGAGRFFLGLVLIARGEHEAALAAMQQETLEGGQLGGLAIAYFALGRKAESDAALARMIKEQANIPFGIAEAYAFRGERDEALRWLDRAYVQKDATLYFIKGDPPMKNLEDDPRYKAFLRKMKLPE